RCEVSTGAYQMSAAALFPEDLVALGRARGFDGADGQFQSGVGAPEDPAEPVGLEGLLDADDDVVLVEDDDVDRELHPEHVDPLARHEPEASTGFDRVPAEEAALAGL